MTKPVCQEIFCSAARGNGAAILDTCLTVGRGLVLPPVICA